MSGGGLRPAFLALALLIGLASARPVAAMEAVFFLVPEASWHSGEIAEGEALGDGKVQLFRPGRLVPTLEVPAGQPVTLPPGTWHWIAEAEGFVSIDGGTVHVESSEAGKPRRLFWPVVPACRAVLDPAASWQGVQRIDLVSPGRRAVYPVTPARRRDQWVPLGETLAYGVGPRGLIGIGRAGACRAGQDLVIPRPLAPGADRFDLMVHASAPDEADGDREAEEVVAPPEARFAIPGRGSLAPLAVLAGPRRTTYFFDELPAGQGEVILQHPLYRSARQPVDGVGGSAIELAALELKARRAATVSVDYRPAREHRVARLELSHCGRSGEVRRWGMPRCDDTGITLPLRPGAHAYRFEGLDDGLYLVNGVVDEAELVALHNGVEIFVDPAGDAVPEVREVLLAEFELFGHLLAEGDPVPGEVRLTLGAGGSPWHTVVRAATDDELLYHLFYFAQLSVQANRLPGDDRRAAAERLGVPFGALLDACDAEGRCRSYPRPIVRGGGRLDLELGTGSGVAVQVSDAATREPVGGADVWLQYPEERLVFQEGEIRTDTVAFTGPVPTDRLGRAVRRDVPPGAMAMAVRKRGYRDAHLEVSVPEDGIVQHLVRLEPATASTTATRLVLPDGGPLTGAFVVGLDGEGRRTGCFVTGDAQGAVELEGAACAASDRFLLLHPRATLAVYRRGELAGAPEAEVAAAPRPPVRLRAVTAAGRPVVGAPIELRLDGVTIGLNDLLVAHGRAGFFLFSATGDDGIATLRGVDPAAGGTVAVRLGDLAAESELRGYRPGEVIELVLTED